MDYLTTRGLVLRTTEYKETDRILTVLSADHGLLTMKARGVRSNRSKLKGACQLLTYAEFTVGEAHGFSSITEATAIEMFPELRTDIVLLSLASYFAQLAEVLSQEDAASPALLPLILNALFALAKLKKPPKLVKAATELRLAALAGYQPELSDPVKAMYRKTATPRDWLAYGQAWASQMIRRPGCYLSATIIQNALLFDVSTCNLAIFTGTGLSAQEEEALDIHRSGTLTRLEKMESSLRQVALALPFALQLNTLGFYCAVLLGARAIACSRKARGMLTILLPQMLTMAVILCGPCIEHQDRYGFPVIYLMPLALAALSCALRRTQRN